MTEQRQALLAEAKRVRDSGYFGRSERLTQAFEILVVASETGRPIKEIELASEVFQNDVRLNSGLDSSVRALVHRLRRKLDQFYAERGMVDGMRLDIPKGTYMLQLVPAEAVEARDEPRTSGQGGVGGSAGTRLLLGICALLILALASFCAYHFTRPSLLMPTEVTRLKDLRATPLWADFLDSPRPTIVVLGYPDMVHEGEASPHIILASAGAIRNLSPLLYADAGNERFMTVMTADRVQAEMIRNNNIIYIGKLDDLGPQLDHIWRGLRISISADASEVVDRETGKRYPISNNPTDASGSHTEYALLSSMSGPDGTRVIIIAGSGNAAASQAAAIAITDKDLNEIARQTKSADNFEALYAVHAHGLAHQGSELLVAAALPSGAWGTTTP